jgi:hypothetical protein
VLFNVAGFGEVGDDAEGGAFGDAQRRGDVAQAYARVLGDADERSGVVGAVAGLRDLNACTARAGARE